MAEESQISFERSKSIPENDFEGLAKLQAGPEERREKITGIFALTSNSAHSNLRNLSPSSRGIVNWTDKVRAAIANLEAKSRRALGPEQALCLVDDVVKGKLAADELPLVHGIPPEWVKTTLAHITKALGSGRVRSLEAGGWYEFRGYEEPYSVAAGFAAAWKEERGLS
jgi:hypothetical protein